MPQASLGSMSSPSLAAPTWTCSPQVALTVGSIVFGLYVITRVLGIDVGGSGGGSSGRPRGRGRKRGRCGAAGPSAVQSALAYAQFALQRPASPRHLAVSCIHVGYAAEGCMTAFAKPLAMLFRKRDTGSCYSTSYSLDDCTSACCMLEKQGHVYASISGFQCCKLCTVKSACQAINHSTVICAGDGPRMGRDLPSGRAENGGVLDVWFERKGAAGRPESRGETGRARPEQW